MTKKKAEKTFIVTTELTENELDKINQFLKVNTGWEFVGTIPKRKACDCSLCFNCKKTLQIRETRTIFVVNVGHVGLCKACFDKLNQQKK